MKEQQIHAAFMVWLKKQGLFYIHATFGKKSTMTKDCPDFTVIHCGRALFVECKTEKGALTAGQKQCFARLQTESGMVVQIARSVEQAVSAVETWLGVESSAGGAVVSKVLPSDGTGTKSDDAAGASYPTPQLFIGNIGGRNYVLFGDSNPGGRASIQRIATAVDLINIPRRRVTLK